MPFLAALGPAFAAIGGGSAAAGAATVGGSVLQGALAGRGQSSSQTQQQTNTGTRNESATSQQVFTPEQLEVLRVIAPQIIGQITDPQAGLEPLRIGARENINAEFSGADQQIRNRFLGGGNVQRSGKANQSALAVDLARRKSLAGNESNFANLALERRDQGSELALRLLGMPFQTSTTGTSTAQGSSSGSSTGRQSGNVAGNALGAGLETAGTLLTLDRLLRRPDSAGAGT